MRKQSSREKSVRRNRSLRRRTARRRAIGERNKLAREAEAEAVLRFEGREVMRELLAAEYGWENEGETWRML